MMGRRNKQHSPLCGIIHMMERERHTPLPSERTLSVELCCYFCTFYGRDYKEQAKKQQQQQMKKSTTIGIFIGCRRNTYVVAELEEAQMKNMLKTKVRRFKYAINVLRGC